MADTIILPSAMALLACLEEKMALNPNPPAHFGLRVGIDPVAADFDQYTDYCCEGLAYVRIQRRFPSGDNFPVADELSSNCMPVAWGVDFAMGSFRCSPDNTDPVQWAESVTNVQNDQQAMAEAICCWKADQETSNAYFMNWFSQDWLPFSNQGGCVGGEWRVTAQFQSCEDCVG